MTMDLSKFTVKDLKSILSQLKHETTGTKAELITRLGNYQFEELRRAADTIPPDYEPEHNAEQEDESDVGKLRDDVGALQRSMEFLTRQLATVIQMSKQLQKDNARLSSESELTKRQDNQACSAVPQSITKTQNLTEGYKETTQTNTVLSNSIAVVMQPPSRTPTHKNNENQSSLIRSSLSKNSDIKVLFPPSVCATTIPTNDITNNVAVSPARSGVIAASDLRSADDRNRLSTVSQSELPFWQSNNIRDLLYVIPEFDPCHGNLSSIQFIERVEQFKDSFQ